jgi:hypothetical protein
MSFGTQVSSNGIVTFQRGFLLSSTPTPFPYGTSRLPAIAPLWMNFDLRNPASRVYHSAYDSSGSPSLGEAVLNKFNLRLPDPDFRAEWVAVITWSSVIPYPHYTFRDCYTGVSGTGTVANIVSWCGIICMPPPQHTHARIHRVSLIVTRI